MVTVDQIKQGAARYLDEEFTAKLTGWRKWAIGAGGAMAIENLDGTLTALQENPVIKALGVFDADGNVDLDRVYAHLRHEAQKGPVTFTAPVLGPVTINERDVEKLYACITQA